MLLDPQLLSFEAVVKEGTVHAAAEALFLTQTAITQRIHQLERKLKTTLFIRSRRGMLLTPEGEQLHRYCQKVSEMSGEVLASIHGAGISSDIRIKIAAQTSIMRSRVIPQCQTVMEKFPKLNLAFLIDDSPDITARLKSGEVDFIITYPEQIPREMTSKPLSPEYYLLVCSEKWQNRPLLEIISEEKIIDFDPTDQMTFSYLKATGLANNLQPERHFVNNTECIAQLFMSEFGYGVLTEEFAKPYIESGQLCALNHGKTYPNRFSLAWYHRSEPPAYFSAIIDSIK